MPPLKTFNNSVTNPTYLTVCVTLEDDSFYIPSYEKVAAAVDLAVANANAFVLPPSIKFRTVAWSAGESCSQGQYMAATRLLQLARTGVKCNAYVGIGCASALVGMYAIAEEANVPIFGCPAAGAAAITLNATSEYSKYPLMVRVPFGLNDLSGVFITLCARFNYTHTTLFRDDSYSFYTFTSQYLMNTFSLLADKLYRNSMERSFTGNGLSDEARAALLLEGKARSRVFILLTPAASIRKFMVFLAIELYDLDYWGRISYSQDDDDDNRALKAFQSLMIVSLANNARTTDLEDNLAQDIKILAKARYNYTFKALEKPDPVIIGFYESIMIYAQEVSTMSAEGLDIYNGSAMTKRIFGTDYIGITGSLNIGPVGQRARAMVIKNFDTETGQFKVAVQYVRDLIVQSGNRSKFQVTERRLWFANSGVMPPDEPQCGFRDDQCQRLSSGLLAVVIIIPLILLTGMTAAAVFAVVKLRELRKDYNPDWWKIYQDDLVIKQNRTGSNTASSKKTLLTVGCDRILRVNCDILASFNNTLVALTDVSGLDVTPNSNIISKLNLLKNATQANLQRFIGIGLTPSGKCQYVVAEICAKGSLTDILSYEDMKLDWSFKNSLIKDLVFGMTYLHTSPIVSHGNLTAHTCQIDTRFPQNFRLRIAFFSGLEAYCFHTDQMIAQSA
ncbi:putative Atrial natriuretic peptide receptor 1 [Hypsibius exemplaris]|uniref:guanylate cyclase n=1 Tax=Hypsibius exemplaris TaxID=2072580 RepID=A0A1W0WAT1_HYPEX|nr:putative Atrial natriuretic peptide receptor 1 [Hypsibius exemplaris]